MSAFYGVNAFISFHQLQSPQLEEEAEEEEEEEEEEDGN